MAIPADIYSSSIIVEAEGIEIDLKVLPDETPQQSRGGHAPKHRETTLLQADTHEESGGEHASTILPSTADLAQSFLESEPKEKTEELQAALSSQSQHLPEAFSDEEDEDVGLHEGMSLPSFVAGFFKSVLDRLQLKVSDVAIRIDMEVQPDLPSSPKQVEMERIDPITGLLTVRNISIDSVATETVEDTRLKVGKRLSSLSEIHFMLVSDQSVFDSYSHFNQPISPSVSHSKTSHDTPKDAADPSSPTPASASSSFHTMTHSTMFERPPSPFFQEPSQENLQEHSQHLGLSMYSQGRFSNAATEDEYDHGSDGYVPRGMTESQYEEFFQEDPACLEELQSADNYIEDSTGDLNSSLRGFGALGSEEPRETSLHPPSREHEHVPAVGTGYSSFQSSFRGRRRARGAEARRNRQEGVEVDQPPDDPYFPGSGQEDNPAPGLDNSEDLSQSRLFTHEEAQSMYMSAMTHRSSSDTGSAPRMPGAWGSPDSHSTLMGRGRESAPREAAQAGPRISGTSPIINQRSSDQGEQEDFQAAPEVETGEHLHLSDHMPHISKKVLEVDKITLWIPPLDDRRAEDAPLDAPQKPMHYPRKSTITISEPVARDTPTTPKPRHLRDDGHRHQDTAAPSAVSDSQSLHGSRLTDDDFSGLTEDETSQAVEVDVTSIAINFDIACGWLLVKMGQRLVTAWSHTTQEEEMKPQSPILPPVPVALSIPACRTQFLEHLPGQVCDLSTTPIRPPQVDNSTGDVILHATLSDTTLHAITVGRTVKSCLNIGKFVFGYASENIVSFDDSLRLRESTRDSLEPSKDDIFVSFRRSPTSSLLDLTTRPLHLALNLRRLDHILDLLGGLSTVLELGSSVVSSPTAKGPKHGRKTKPRGVHFAEPPAPNRPQKDDLSLKVNCRVGGMAIDVVGKSCSVKLNTSAMKFASRFGGVSGARIQIDMARLSGPHCSSVASDTTPHANFTNIRLEYRSEPEEKDLDRLLSLLTPSKDKYGEDDDIMLDTLVRQRRKGALLRITVSKLSTAIFHPGTLLPLSNLGDELAKFSRFAKYFPEDDTPGIMTLALVREFDCQFDLGKDVGTVSIVAHGVEGCHVSFPSLIAAQLLTITVARNGGEELLGQAINQKKPNVATPRAPPMIMARYIAGEMEPAVKLKLFNLRVEYSVPTVVALLGLSNEMTTEDIAANMAHSVANLADLKAHHEGSEGHLDSPSVASDVPGEPPIPQRLSVSMRDCLIGLNPRQAPAKGLVVLTRAQFSGALHEREPSEATLDIQKASLVIIDDVDNVGVADNFRRGKSSSTQSGQVRTLEDMGYVPVCYVSSARAHVKVMQLEADGEKSLDIELEDDLLIIETCADSTQTLITLLNGLTLPSPPSKTLKYRTEVMPIEDMLGSFSGGAFEMAQPASPDTPSAGVGEPSFAAEDVADELEYVSDFPPTSAGAGKNDTAGEGFEKLLDSFHSDVQVSSGILGLDIQEDHFAKQSAVGGTAHRWDSTHNTYSLANEVKLHGSPLRVRARDVHVIWNLFDGYDWQKTRDAISKTAKDVQIKATEKRSRPSPAEEEDEESVIGDFLFNSVYIGIPTNRDPQLLSHDINRNIDDLATETASYATSTTVTGLPSHPPGKKREKLRLARSKHHKMTFELKGLAADMVVFPPGSGETQSSLDIRVHDVEIFDHLPSSTWKKFATYMHDAGEREIGTSMVHLEALNVKPVADLAASELILKVCLLLCVSYYTFGLHRIN